MKNKRESGQSGREATPCLGRALSARLLMGAMAGILALSLSAPAGAQTTTQPLARTPDHIHWQLLVLLDGQQVDSFSGDTTVGQSQTVTHHHATSHAVGCEGAQTPATDLSRTISVSPLGVDSNNVIGFEISADDVIEDTTARAVQGTGCALPPQTRTISARHPELDVPSGKSSDWVLLKKQPQLIYRLEANVAANASPN